MQSNISSNEKQLILVVVYCPPNDLNYIKSINIYNILNTIKDKYKKPNIIVMVILI